MSQCTQTLLKLCYKLWRYTRNWKFHNTQSTGNSVYHSFHRIHEIRVAEFETLCCTDPSDGTKVRDVGVGSHFWEVDEVLVLQ